MTIRILTFGKCREIIGRENWEFSVGSNEISVAELRDSITQDYPELSRLNSLAIAINQEYATDEMLCRDGDVVALIPPVSGG